MTTNISFGKTDKGQKRINNEDSLLIDETKSLYLLADGMGGHKAGEIASQLACEYFNRYFDKQSKNIKVSLTKTFSKINKIIFEEAKKREELSGMGTTFIACHIDNEAAHFCHAGDVRAYLFRDNNLLQITEDHSTVALMLKKNLITKEEAKLHPLRSHINKAVGTEENVEPDYNKLEINLNDIILLCSDGLWNMLEDTEIQNIFGKSENIEGKTHELIDAANSAGGKDNITVIIVEIN